MLEASNQLKNPFHNGVLLHLTDGGSALALKDHPTCIIVHSDNTATNILIEALGMDAINALSASLGAIETRMQRLMIRPEESARGDENLSTPRDAARIGAHCRLHLAKV